jgi:DNA-binding MarR family transcriptional regulator
VEQTPRIRRTHGTAQLLEQVARRLFEKRHPDDLHPVQWAALRYFARAGRRTANIAGLSNFLGNTSGSTSRTAKSLVERGLLTTEPSDHDGRSVTFCLTEAGVTALEADPIRDVANLLAALPEDELRQFARILTRIHGDLAHRRAP